MSDYTDAELSALHRALASGTTRVEYEGRSVTYDDVEGLLRRIQVIERAMSATPRPKVGFAGFRRGY